MKKRFLVMNILLLATYCSLAQNVGIGTLTPDASAALDISNTGKGLLIPRMSTASINAITNPAKGLLVYDSVANQLMVNKGTPAAPSWQAVALNGAWGLGGNSGINPSTQFVGNTDNQPLRFRVNNIPAGELHPLSGNIFWGLRAGQSNSTGFSNIAIGTDALKLNTVRGNLVAVGDSALFNNNGSATGEGAANTAIGSKALFSNTTGNHNAASGYKSLFSNTTGSVNTAYGSSSLFNNTTGRFNVAVGTSSMLSNISSEANTAVGYRSLASSNASDNTAIGFESMASNTSGTSNTAAGLQSLFSNTNGIFNSALGQQALYSNTSGSLNVGVGFQALFSNTTSHANTGVGYRSLHGNSTGASNTGLGHFSLVNNTTGTENTGLGASALFDNVTGSFNVGVGRQALSTTTGSQFNTAVGYRAGASNDMGWNNTFIGANATANAPGIFNSVAIGESAVCTGNNMVRLGNNFTTSIGGFVGFSNLSDGRYKKNIKDDVRGLDFIMKLRPVTYQMDVAGLNSKLYAGRSQDESSANIAEQEKQIFSGFVAQEVEQAAKETGYDFSGVDKPKNQNDLYALRYAEFVVPIVKAVQEQQKIIEELKKQNADLQKRIEALERK